MTEDQLPLTVREFLERYITSIEQLDILQVFSAEPDSHLTATEVFRRVLTSIPSIEHQLRLFKTAGFLEELPGTGVPVYRSSPAGGLHSATALTLTCYKETPVRVIRFMYERKPSGPQGFADAFKFKQPDK